MIYQHTKVRTSDLIGLMIDIGLKEKHWINLGVIINKSYNSYKLQDKWKNLGLIHLQTLTQLVTHYYSLVLRIVVLVTLLVRINTIQKEKRTASSFFLQFIYFSWNPTFSLVFELTYGVRLKVSIFILCYSIRHMTCKLPVIGNCSTTVPNQHFSLQNYYSQYKIMYQDDIYQISSQIEQQRKCYS